MTAITLRQKILKKFTAFFVKYELDSRRNGHYNDIIMGAVVSQITSLTIVYSADYSDEDQRIHQSSVSLAFVRMASKAENVSIWWRHHE